MCSLSPPFGHGATRFSRKGVAREDLRPEVPPDTPDRIVKLMRALMACISLDIVYGADLADRSKSYFNEAVWWSQYQYLVL